MAGARRYGKATAPGLFNRRNSGRPPVLRTVPQTEKRVASHPSESQDASPQEWFPHQKEGIELGMFHPIHESLVFRDHNGQKVLKCHGGREEKAA